MAKSRIASIIHLALGHGPIVKYQSAKDLAFLAEAALTFWNVLFAANQEEFLNSFAGFDLARIEIPGGIRH